MVAARRSFDGELPLAAMPRLREALADGEGVARYEMEFGRDGFGTAFLDLRVQAPLTLVCQRTLEPFVLPVSLHSRLGLIRAEREEAALPADSEPLLVGADGRLDPVEVIEDELLLALPLIPVNPDSDLPVEATHHPAAEATSAAGNTDNPFAVLRGLKQH